MRFLSITPRAFGPLTAGSSYDVAPGMTVFAGPNEAGKSSLHAAFYAALCGIRRGLGAARRDDVAFEERHRPWASQEWKVSATITLDGRRIELRHDLSRKEGHAVDLDLGRDYSSEVVHDGAVDGSRFIGLNRETFARTAFIRQAQIRDFEENTEALKEELQQAVATGSHGETAVGAITAIDEFLNENVGSDRAYTKPRSATRVELARRQEELRQARAQHDDYVRECTRRDERLAHDKKAQRKLLLADVAYARFQAGALSRRIEQAQTIANALEGARLGEGDTVPSPEIQSAYRKLVQISSAAREHAEAVPSRSTPPAVAYETPRNALWAYIFAAIIGLAISVSGFATGHWFLMTAGLVILTVGALGASYVRRRTGRKAPMQGMDHAAIGDSWEERRQELGREIRGLESGLQSLFRARGYEQADDLATLHARYVADCTARAAEVAKREQLRAVLDGKSAEALEQDLSDRRRELETLETRLTANERAMLEHEPIPDVTALRSLREVAQKASTAATSASGDVEAMKRNLVDVAEVEEAVSRASDELGRLDRLAATLETAKMFLERAEDTVNRQIAPRINATLEKWLPRITANRYITARVDPDDLSIRVGSDGGELRFARLLSHGTAEQIYLLLRIAMLDHLAAASGETCPILLDDVTAHCDDERTIAIMNLLHEISSERQVIVFTQQRAVAEWAEAALTSDKDKLIKLDVLQAS